MATPVTPEASAATPDFDIVHIKQADGRCVISIDGQGHLPCGEHSAASWHWTPDQIAWAIDHNSDAAVKATRLLLAHAADCFAPACPTCQAITEATSD